MVSTEVLGLNPGFSNFVQLLAPSLVTNKPEIVPAKIVPSLG